jgi:hypothetical protein
MNTIITRHYPASKLPEDLREGIDPSSLVTVTIVQRNISPSEAVADADRDKIAGQPVIRTNEEANIDLDRRGAERDE